jgi:hypothetical protein
VRACLVRNAPGPYQIQAAIQAVHADASSVAQTDWGEGTARLEPGSRVANGGPFRRREVDRAANPDAEARCSCSRRPSPARGLNGECFFLVFLRG